MLPVYMVKIEDYILLPKQIRQAHLRLHEPCIERGGASYQFKGLLAHILDTTLPKKKPHLCHACYNGNCGNPYHMYWGTPKENRLDSIANGEPSFWQKRVNKHGEDAVRQEQSILAKKAWATSGRKRSNWQPFPEDKRNEILELLYSSNDYIGIATKTATSWRAVTAIFSNAKKGAYGQEVATKIAAQIEKKQTNVLQFRTTA